MAQQQKEKHEDGFELRRSKVAAGSMTKVLCETYFTQSVAKDFSKIDRVFCGTN
jgi:hypothetical protein